MPMQEESLLVPKTKWVGRPEKAIRYTGTEIMPPPPAMASIKPAQKDAAADQKDHPQGEAVQRGFREESGDRG